MSKKAEEHDRELFFSHFPSDVSQCVQDYVRDVVLLRSRYIFTTREKGLQYGYCTHCREKYRTVGLKQNEKKVCVKCGSQCTVKKSGISRKYLVDRGHIIFYEKSLANPNAIIARSMYVHRDYSKDYIDVETLYSPSAMYVFEMGNAQMYEPWWGNREWRKVSTIKSDFQNSLSFGYRSLCPIEWIREAVAGTPFQYSTWEQYHETDSVKFFSLFTKYPCIEYLTKLGMRYFVSAKLDNGLTYSAINWNGKTIDKVLKLSKQRSKEFIKMIDQVNNPLTLRLFQVMCNEKSGLTLSELDDLADRYDRCWSLLQKLLTHVSLRRADGYIRKQQTIEKMNKRAFWERDILCTWRDYIEDCKQLGLDLTDELILLPPDLHSAHQNTIKQVKYKEDEELNRKIQKRLKVLTKYEFEKDGLLIRAAKDSLELIEEGKALRHCVGRYAQSYADGKCDILVIRWVSEPDKPFYTMEIRDNKIVQCRGFKNCGTTDKVQLFVDAFVKEKLTKKKARVKVDAQQEVAV
ncbi:PcfJ-like protein [Paenibacillus cellulosilyticus]|uniref:PcfJ-like protein n=1 Tax=Paenibacillus cellulosilyticus TaxID=375489 RepID=A0A2V2YSA1_9BACL|nr:PcfJ domain-containing protein [Paenibacillus cellulosilyticus]PWV97462.1 PcfJ-like protein [Paenibacillus cellulosilyticus]QKS48501.1 PcfJ domain-containing protein [Paenibacillus cellulosilyticus]